MKFNRCGYLFREGFRSIGTHGFMSFASVTIIMACLIIMGSVSLLSLNVDSAIEKLENQNEVVAIIDEALSEEQAKSLEASLLTIENISDVEFVNRAQAMTNFMSNYSEDLMDGIDETVFRHRFIIHLVDISLMNETKLSLEEIPGVVKVNCQVSYAKAFVSLRNIVTVISLILIVILVFVSLFIMSNTIKLATYGRREEIAIMKMVGAGNSFIRLPFVVEGLVLGIIGGGLAYLAEWGLYELVTGKLVTMLTGSFINVIAFDSISIYVFAAYMAISVFVGVFGGVYAIKNYLKV